MKKKTKKIVLRINTSLNEIDDACLNYRHDFGLLDLSAQADLRCQAIEWLKAWAKVE